MPFFGSSVLLGVVLAGGSLASLNAWLGFIIGAAFMAAGHTWNSALDYYAGLDEGEEDERSAEKVYSAGQSLIASGVVSLREVAIIAIIFDVLGAALAVYLSLKIGNWYILTVSMFSMIVPFAYTLAKFSYFHEFVLFIGTGPLSAMIGMCAVSSSSPWWAGIAASAPIGLILSFVGLPLDEYPDAEANLAKGVKSIAYKVWQYEIDLGFYTIAWVGFVYMLQLALIIAGILSPLTWLTFILVPFFMAAIVFLKKWFKKTAVALVFIGALYPVITLVGQIAGD